MPRLTWSDTDEVGFELNEKFPEVDPLTVRFTDLRQRVLGLPEFADKPDASSEKTLEAIQMAWLEYYRQNAPG